MKKQRLFSKRSLKTVVAVAIAAALAVPVTTSLKPVIADETAVATVVPERLLDFNEGLKEYYTDEALKLDIINSVSELSAIRCICLQDKRRIRGNRPCRC